VRGTRRQVAAAGLVLAAVLVGTACLPPGQHQAVDPVGEPAPGSQLIGCDQAAQRIAVAGIAHLDPSCTYATGFDITTSGTTLDCRGAVIRQEGDERLHGILIETPVGVPLSDVTVRNCVVEGFSNSMRIRREGFKDLVQGAEYENGTSSILVENSRFYDSEASGIFVDGFVTGVTLRGLEIAGSGAVGLYLEAGSKDNVVENNTIHRNGFKDVVPEGVPIIVGGTELRYESTGREGIAVDGSRGNVIRNNWIAGNAAGGIFLYKNCGEDAASNGHWVRHYGATGNTITGNFISTEKNGIWVGSRAAENQDFMDCSDEPYIEATLRRVYLDPANGNTISDNSFLYVNHGIRVEDDDTTIENNRFSSPAATDQAVLIGTKERTQVLDRPVTGTVLRGNRSDIAGNATPYGWVWGHTDTVDEDNRRGQAVVALAPGTQPTINPFLFAIRIWAP
jgi:parallel beta-helix repeat protein